MRPTRAIIKKHFDAGRPCMYWDNGETVYINVFTANNFTILYSATHWYTIKSLPGSAADAGSEHGKYGYNINALTTQVRCKHYKFITSKEAKTDIFIATL